MRHYKNLSLQYATSSVDLQATQSSCYTWHCCNRRTASPTAGAIESGRLPFYRNQEVLKRCLSPRMMHHKPAVPMLLFYPHVTLVPEFFGVPRDLNKKLVRRGTDIDPLKSYLYSDEFHSPSLRRAKNPPFVSTCQNPWISMQF